jgi:Xaa-Pro aminopeptidase
MRGTSPGERDRRRAALRSAAADQGWDALIVCGRGDEFLRGRIQYAADVLQWAGWGYLLLPASAPPTLLADPLAGFTHTDPEAPWVQDVRMTQEPGRELAETLTDHGLARARVGVVGLDDIAAAGHIRQLGELAPHVELAEATDAFESVRGVKSAEEIANLDETSAILRTVFTALEAELRPGALVRDVLAHAHRLCRLHGCVDGIAMLNRPPSPAFSHGTDEPLRRDDVLTVDLEWGGPSGYWLELRRCYSFGPPPDAARRIWEARVETFDACLEAIKPGAASADILAARDRTLARHGLTAEGSVVYSAHGIGIDSLEPPWVPGKERELREGMVLSLHPDVRLGQDDLRAAGGVSAGDNVLVTAGGARRMTYATEEWIVLEA